jgi:hypothetical protein
MRNNRIRDENRVQACLLGTPAQISIFAVKHDVWIVAV